MPAVIRHDWCAEELHALFDLPLPELLFRAASVHRQHFDPARIQTCALLSVKTGGCPEDCGYCPQAQRHATGVRAQKLLDTAAVLVKARQARDAGASRFCMGAAWRSPRDRDIPKVAAMITAVKALGLETCATLGMLSGKQARALRDAGLDYYNHNLDTAPDYYDAIIHTRSYQDRLDTLEHVRAAGLKTCCGGIVGMGETRAHRVGLLLALATLPVHPDSVPINRLVQVAGTPLHGSAELDPFEFVRMIAVARIAMPAAMLRLAAGRESMSDELQALCFLAGANSIFHGDKLLTTGNPDRGRDRALFARLGIVPMTAAAPRHDPPAPRTRRTSPNPPPALPHARTGKLARMHRPAPKRTPGPAPAAAGADKRRRAADISPGTTAWLPVRRRAGLDASSMRVHHARPATPGCERCKDVPPHCRRGHPVMPATSARP